MLMLERKVHVVFSLRFHSTALAHHLPAGARGVEQGVINGHLHDHAHTQDTMHRHTFSWPCPNSSCLGEAYRQAGFKTPGGPGLSFPEKTPGYIVCPMAL